MREMEVKFPLLLVILSLTQLIRYISLLDFNLDYIKHFNFFINNLFSINIIDNLKILFSYNGKLIILLGLIFLVVSYALHIVYTFKEINKTLREKNIKRCLIDLKVFKFYVTWDIVNRN